MLKKPTNEIYQTYVLSPMPLRLLTIRRLSKCIFYDVPIRSILITQFTLLINEKEKLFYLKIDDQVFKESHSVWKNVFNSLKKYQNQFIVE